MAPFVRDGRLWQTTVQYRGARWIYHEYELMAVLALTFMPLPALSRMFFVLSLHALTRLHQFLPPPPPPPNLGRQYTLPHLWSDDFCWQTLRFARRDLDRLGRCCRLPLDPPHLPNNARPPAMLCLTMFLWRWSYPRRVRDGPEVFGCSIGTISEGARWAALHIMTTNRRRLRRSAVLLSAERLRVYSAFLAVMLGEDVAPPLRDRLCGFVDGTVRPTCRPIWLQEWFFSGHKRLHGYKYMLIGFPDGMTVIHGPFRAARHDDVCWRWSRIENVFRDGGFRVYGDKAFHFDDVLFRLREGDAWYDVRAARKLSIWRTACTEWLFGSLLRTWQTLSFKPANKILHTVPCAIYEALHFVSNVRTCFYGNQLCSRYEGRHLMGVAPPMAETYAGSSVRDLLSTPPAPHTFGSMAKIAAGSTCGVPGNPGPPGEGVAARP